MKYGIRYLSLLLCLVILAGCLTGVTAAQEGIEATILFTHDLHSHFLPAVDEDGGEYGGYARLMTAIRQQKAIDPNPRKRWQTPIEMGQALVSYMQRNTVQDVPIVPPTGSQNIGEAASTQSGTDDETAPDAMDEDSRLEGCRRATESL